MSPEAMSYVFLVGYIVFQSIVGFGLVRWKMGKIVNWILPILSIFISHFLFLEAIPMVRMLCIIFPLLHSMKIIVATYHPSGKLGVQGWMAYYFLTVGMNPAIFQSRSRVSLDKVLISKAVLSIVIGSAALVIAVLLRNSYVGENIQKFWGVSILGLVGLSLIFHFGLLSLNTVILKLIGYNDYVIFRKPFLARSLSEFWGKRWNLAFSEMTRTIVFKPLSRKFDPKLANLIAFLFSGLLHEIAISLTVMKGFGLPMVYFIISGIGMRLEKKIFSKQNPGLWWVLIFLMIPLPLLFHYTFLKEVIWDTLDQIIIVLG